MLSPSLREQIKCRWREFRREPSAFFWVIFMPIIWMLALGFAFSKPRPETYGVGWLFPAEESSFSQNLESQLSANTQVKLRRGSVELLNSKMKRGEIALLIKVLPPQQVQYILDESNPEAVRAKAYVDDLVQKAGGRLDPVATETRTVNTEGGRYVDFLIPGLLGLSIMTSSLFGVGMTIVSNRKENLLKRYLATPMRAWEYIVSHIFGRMIVLSAEFLAVMITGFLVFKFKVYGSFLSYIVFTILGAAAFTGIALLCAARTKSIPMISGLTNLISLPMMMLSGVFFSKNNLPDWLLTLTNFLPLTALNDGLRKIALEGVGLFELPFELLVLSTYAIVCAGLAKYRFRWY